MKRHIIFAIIIAAILFLQEALSSDINRIESLPRLVEEALNNNPSVQEAYNAWRAAEYRISQSMSLPDPKASYTFFGESVETKVGPQEYKLGASQMIPFPAKLGLKGKVDARYADMLKEKYEAAKREIVKNVKFTYYDIFWVNSAIQITEEEKTILENLESVARRKYESNMAPLQDAIKAEVELSKLEDRLILLKQNQKSLYAKIISILNRPGGEAFNSIEPVETGEFVYSLDNLHQIAMESKQELLAARLDIERREYERSLARFDYLPDVTLGFDFIEVGKGHTMQPDDGKNAWTGTVAINVPIWFDRLDAQLKEKKASLESSKNRYRDIENTVYYEVEDVYFKVLAYKDIISLYKTALIPQTEQAFEAARTGYESARVDFLNWLDAERTLLHTRLAYYKAIADYSKSIAYLERVVGRDL